MDCSVCFHFVEMVVQVLVFCAAQILEFLVQGAWMLPETARPSICNPESLSCSNLCQKKLKE